MTIKYSTICVCITLNLFSYLVFTFFLGFPGGSDAEESACSTGDLGLIPGLGRLPGEGNGYPLQYSCLENSMDRGTWWKYSPWGRNESDMTEQLTYFFLIVVVQSLSRVQLFVTPWTAACQASLSFTISRSCSNSCPLSQWCHPTISSSVVPFSSCLQSFPASGSFLMFQLFTS